MVAAGWKEYGSRSFNTDFSYTLELTTVLKHWDCMLFGLIITLNVGAMPLELGSLLPLILEFERFFKCHVYVSGIRQPTSTCFCGYEKTYNGQCATVKSFMCES